MMDERESCVLWLEDFSILVCCMLRWKVMIIGCWGCVWRMFFRACVFSFILGHRFPQTPHSLANEKRGESCVTLIISMAVTFITLCKENLISQYH